MRRALVTGLLLAVSLTLFAGCSGKETQGPVPTHRPGDRLKKPGAGDKP
jgi:hypothetical protein